MSLRKAARKEYFLKLDCYPNHSSPLNTFYRFSHSLIVVFLLCVVFSARLQRFSCASPLLVASLTRVPRCVCETKGVIQSDFITILCVDATDSVVRIRQDQNHFELRTPRGMKEEDTKGKLYIFKSTWREENQSERRRRREREREKAKVMRERER